MTAYYLLLTKKNDFPGIPIEVWIKPEAGDPNFERWQKAYRETVAALKEAGERDLARKLQNMAEE